MITIKVSFSDKTRIYTRPRAVGMGYREAKVRKTRVEEEVRTEEERVA